LVPVWHLDIPLDRWQQRCRIHRKDIYCRLGFVSNYATTFIRSIFLEIETSFSISQYIFYILSIAFFIWSLVLILLHIFSPSGVNHSCSRFLAIWRKVSVHCSAIFILFTLQLIWNCLNSYYLFVFNVCFWGFISTISLGRLTYKMLPDYFSCWDAFLSNRKEDGRNSMRSVTSHYSLSNGFWTWLLDLLQWNVCLYLWVWYMYVSYQDLLLAYIGETEHYQIRALNGSAWLNSHLIGAVVMYS